MFPARPNSRSSRAGPECPFSGRLRGNRPLSASLGGSKLAAMGLVYGNFRLSNPRSAATPAIEVPALVDTGAMMLCVPPALAASLGLEELEKREVTLADGGRHLVPYVGPVQISFGKRSCFTGAFAVGTQVLVGAIALEDMDLVISPATREVTVNPASPDIPSAIIMAAHRVAGESAAHYGISR